jgi:hypothetical protein
MLLEAHRNSSKLMKGKQQQQQQKKPKIDAHCWIKVERKSGEASLGGGVRGLLDWLLN